MSCMSRQRQESLHVTFRLRYYLLVVSFPNDAIEGEEASSSPETFILSRLREKVCKQDMDPSTYESALECVRLLDK